MEFPVHLPSGITLTCVEHGDGDGLPVLLLHGLTDSWHSYAPVLPHLSARIRAFALTQRGHGNADRPAVGYRTRDFARDAAEFLDAVGVERAVIVGHSMGSANALRFAIDFPERTLGLVLLGAFASFSRNAVVRDLWENGVSKLADPVDPAFAREFQQSTLAQPVPDAYLDLVVAESLKVPALVWRAALLGLMEDDFVNDLGRVRVPAQIFWGRQDLLCPRGDQDLLLEAIPGSQLFAYEHAGHALHWEEPERFAGDLVRIAERIAATAETALR